MTNKVKELIEIIDSRLSTEEGLALPLTAQFLVDCKTELERLEADNAWQPIETAPKDGRYLLMLRYGASLPDILRWDDSISMWADCVFEGSKKSKKAIEKISWEQNIVHWRPLPQQPEGV